MLRHPPDILITTPESLYLLLTSRAARCSPASRPSSSTRSTPSPDEARRPPCALARAARALADAPRSASASRRRSGRWRRSRASSAGTARPARRRRAREGLDLRVIVPVGTCAAGPGPRRRAPGTGSEGSAGSIWPSIYPELLRLVAEHRSTIVFVNSRRLAERLAQRLDELRRGSRARTTARSRASSGWRSRSC